MDLEVNIKTIKLCREAWLKEIPNVIKNLKLNYNFYYSGQYARTQKHIQDLVKEKYKKNRHKMILYVNTISLDFYLVIYAKKTVTIYWCDEYKGARWANIRYFEKKFSLAYEEAVRCLEERELPSFQ